MRSGKVSDLIRAVLVVCGLLACAPCAAGEDAPDWWKAEHDVTATLMDGQMGIADLVAQVTASERTTAQEAIFTLNTLLRAGMSAEAIATVHRLKTLCPDLDSHPIECIYYAACNDFKGWEVAKSTLDVFADNIRQVQLGNRLTAHLLASGWSVEEVDGWLARKPKGFRGFWLKERVDFNRRQDRLLEIEAIVQEYTEGVREKPEDISGVVEFLDVLCHARQGTEQKDDLTWMTGDVKPRLATQAADIASRLMRVGEWRAAAHFQRLAIEIPLSDEEVRNLGMMSQALRPNVEIRAGFAANAREGLAKCLLELGRNDEAQEWMVEADDIREEHHLGRNTLFAGQIQGASGQHTVEERIRDEEQRSKDDPEYWRERARYYRGRNDVLQQEEALERGLALAPVQPPPVGKVPGDVRSGLLSDYVRFLVNQNRTEEAVALLRKELGEAPAESASSGTAARLLAFDLAQAAMRVDDEVLWEWLANRPEWNTTEKRMLWRMLENAEQDKLDRHFSRAEALVQGAHASRARALGWILNRMSFPKRSIPLLKYAIENAPENDLAERARFTLLESYLDMDDWKHAEAIFPQARRRLTPRELPEWYARVAVAAAKAGATDDAMRIWRRVANVDLSTTHGLTALVNAGLRDELKRFYSEMHEQLPSSEIPPRILATLEQK